MKVGLGPGSGSFEETADVTDREGIAPPDLPTARYTMMTQWVQRGACAKAEPDALFVRGAAQEAAKKLCLGCPVIAECLAEALDNRTEHGVWGGMTERERRALLKRRPDVTSWRALFQANRTRCRTTPLEARSPHPN